MASRVYKLSGSQDDLPIQARRAWLAYQDMCKSKQTYFKLLHELDQKYGDVDHSPSFAENLKLEQLLKKHGEKVKKFNEAMAAVGEKNARESLLNKLKEAANN